MEGHKTPLTRSLYIIGLKYGVVFMFLTITFSISKGLFDLILERTSFTSTLEPDELLYPNLLVINHGLVVYRSQLLTPSPTTY